jgi:hypothetical protein
MCRMRIQIRYCFPLSGLADGKILLLLTLLAIELVPKPVPPTVAAEVLRLCLVGLNDERNLAALSSLRSLSVSKILKTELSSLQTQMTKSHILSAGLTSRHLALNVLIDLRVSDIHPICAFLQDSNEEDQWTTLTAIAGSLEKSTQGRVITGLKARDVEVFNPILQQGLSEFETDGTSSSSVADHSHSTKSDVEFPSCMHQSHQFQWSSMRVSKQSFPVIDNPNRYYHRRSSTLH